jgi:hypothetical protein
MSVDEPNGTRSRIVGADCRRSADSVNTLRVLSSPVR